MQKLTDHTITAEPENEVALVASFTAGVMYTLLMGLIEGKFKKL